MIDYNALYRFVSDGTWFKAATECTVEDGDSLWHLDQPSRTEPFTLEELTLQRDRIMGVFRGTRVIEDPAAEGGGVVGEEREDGEVCGLDEFTVTKRDLFTT